MGRKKQTNKQMEGKEREREKDRQTAIDFLPKRSERLPKLGRISPIWAGEVREVEHGPSRGNSITASGRARVINSSADSCQAGTTSVKCTRGTQSLLRSMIS